MSSDSQPRKSWGEALKDPKVLAVLIPIISTSIAGSYKLAMDVGRLQAEVEHYQAEMSRMYVMIEQLTEQCGGRK